MSTTATKACATSGTGTVYHEATYRALLGRRQSAVVVRAVGQVGDEGAVTRYRIYGISDDYVAVDDGERVRRYPFDWNSYGSIIVHFKDEETELRAEWRYDHRDVSRESYAREVDEGDRFDLRWTVEISLTRGHAHLGASPRSRANEPMVELHCTALPEITVYPSGDKYTFPDGETRDGERPLP